ncbi:MAG: TolC family protein [bacterium]|nr:TolC family protein [bacterium]
MNTTSLPIVWLLFALLPSFFIPGVSRAKEPSRIHQGFLETDRREVAEVDREATAEVGQEPSGSEPSGSEPSGLEQKTEVPKSSSGPSSPEYLTFSLEDAVLLALNRNRDLKVQIINPQIAETAVEEKKASFDFEPSLKLQVEQTTDSSLLSQKDIRKAARDEYPNMPDEIFDSYFNEYFGNVRQAEIEKKAQISGGALSLSKLFSTGTRLELNLQGQYSDEERSQRISKTDAAEEKLSSSSSRSNASASLTLTQPLLAGRGRKINLCLVREAEFDRQISAYELKQYVIELVARVQKTYWDLVLAEEKLSIREKSLELSERQMEETKEKIRLGKQAESELIFAQAEVAAEKGKVIDAKSILTQRTLDFLRLLNPEVDMLWERRVTLTTPPAPIEQEIGPMDELIATAFRSRADLAQAYLNLQKGDLEVIRTQNGLMPRLDFFITLKSLASGIQFPVSLSDFNGSDYAVGFSLSRPLGNIGAKAQSRRAGLSRLKYLESIENLKQAIQVEVRKAVVEIERCRQQIVAMQANRSRQEEKLKVEQEKFRLGRSTNLAVFQAQRDLTEAKLGEVTAVVDQIKAFIDLKVCQGTLLQEWSIEMASPLIR